MKHSAATLYQKEGTKKVLASLISILAGLLVGGIAVILVGCFNEKISLSGAWDGFRIIFAGIFSTGRNAAGELTWGFNAVNTGDMLFRATPLIMTGLSVAVAFKTGLFNIGAPGQYLISTMATLMIALSIPSSSVPTWIIWILAFLGGCLAGALWGALPGLAKACLNINEVLACIMTNWVAANLVTWMFDISNFKNTVENTKSGYIYKTSFNGVATPKLGLDKLFPGSQVNAGILVAILLAIAMYILMTKTTLGYELQACGANRHAARYAGIKDKRNIVLSMAIAGALAAKKELILYDEPTSGLDYRNMERVAQNINALAEAGKTQLVITHDPELVEKCCDYYLFFENGEIIEYGTWSERTINRIRDYFDIGTFGHV